MIDLNLAVDCELFTVNGPNARDPSILLKYTLECKNHVLSPSPA